MTELWQLFISFFKVGLFTFGGGYAMFPMLQREIIDKRHWATNEDILNYFSISQCAPGVNAVNTSVFIGYKQKGILGGICAALGVIAPSLIIIIVIASLLKNYTHIEAVKHAFAGIRAAVAVLVINAVIGLIKNNVKSVLQIIICIVSFLIIAFGHSPIIVIIGAVVAGLALGTWGKKSYV